MKIILALLAVVALAREPKAQARLNAKFESFEKCQKKTGKVGRVAEMVVYKDDQPITIKSKQSYCELDTDHLTLYVDEFKTEVYKTVKLTHIDKLTIPKSFQQPGYEVNCFQMSTDRLHKGKITVDTEKEEPYNAADVEMTLCFKDPAQLKEWKEAVVDFYENCGVKRPNVDENEEKEGQPETLIAVENKIKTLIDTAYALSKEFEVIKKQREYQDKIVAQAQKEEAKYQVEKKEKFEKVRKQTPIDNLEYGTAKDCEQVAEDKADVSEDEERRKLAEVKDEADIDMADIDALQDLSEEERQKKKEKRVALFKTMQSEAQKEKKRLNKASKYQKEEESAPAEKESAVDMEPIKLLLSKLISMKQNKK